VSLCILAAGKTITIAATVFTLSWTHSVEKTRWKEYWRITPAGFEMVEARIKGSGAGMEPPPEARIEDGWWAYVPKIPPRPEIVLAASGATGAGWSLCAAGRCIELGAAAGEPVRLKPCGEAGSSQPR
jgi:hypothetical protein